MIHGSKKRARQKIALRVIRLLTMVVLVASLAIPLGGVALAGSWNQDTSFPPGAFTSDAAYTLCEITNPNDCGNVYGRGRDMAFYQARFRDGWQGWTQVGGSSAFSSEPVAIIRDFSIPLEDVFGRGQNGQLYWHVSQGGSGWQSLGGAMAPGSIPAASAAGNDDMAVVVRGNDNAYYMNHFKDGWGGYQLAGNGGSFTGEPAIVAIGSEYYLLGRGRDGALYWSKFTNTAGPGGTFTNWESRGGGVNSDIWVAAGSDGFNVYVRGGDLQFFTIQRNVGTNTWSDWLALGGAFNSAPASPARTQRRDVLGFGRDNHLYHSFSSTQTGNFTGFGLAAGGPFVGNPVAPVEDPDVASEGFFGVVVRGTDGVYKRYFQTD